MSEQREALTVAEAAVYLGIGRNLAYQLVREKRLFALRLHRRLVVPRSALDALLAGASPAQGADS